MTEQPHTEFAMAAVDFAGLFNNVFDQENLSGFQVRLTAPEGPSTGGGIQARQHITLINPTNDKTIVIGGCNNVEKKAELRHFDMVEQQYQNRFQVEIPIDRTEFNKLQNKLADFFKNQLIQVNLAQTRAPEPVQQPPQNKTQGLIKGLILSLLVIGLIVAAFFVLND